MYKYFQIEEYHDTLHELNANLQRISEWADGNELQRKLNSCA